ncbi:hypothetical protein MRX96_048793 [Rhipicephalus microplus]
MNYRSDVSVACAGPFVCRHKSCFKYEKCVDFGKKKKKNREDAMPHYAEFTCHKREGEYTHQGRRKELQGIKSPQHTISPPKQTSHRFILQQVQILHTARDIHERAKTLHAHLHNSPTITQRREH